MLYEKEIMDEQTVNFMKDILTNNRAYEQRYFGVFQEDYPHSIHREEKLLNVRMIAKGSYKDLYFSNFLY